MDFEDYAVKVGLKVNRYSYGEYQFYKTQVAYDAFEAGQQSKQAEIDALKAKIDNLTKWAEFHIEDYSLSESDGEYDRGWFNAACQVFTTLKESNNDT